MGNNATLGLRPAGLLINHRIAVLIKNRDPQSLVAHLNWELERLTNLVSVRSEGHNTGHRINRNLILSDALRQCAKPEPRCTPSIRELQRRHLEPEPDRPQDLDRHQ